MFSRIPTPHLNWESANMQYIMAALPLVGAVCGLAVWLWAWLCGALGFGTVLSAAGFALVPVAVTGGIHLDGLADTADALASNAPPERKREILKDPTAGAFAVISVVCYLLLYVALCTELSFTGQSAFVMTMIFMASRAAGALSVLCLPSSKSGGLLDTFKDSSGKTAVIVLAVVAVACGAGLLYAQPLCGAAALCAAALCFVYLSVMSRRQFGGMSGDLAGFLIQLCELCMLAAWVLMQMIIRVVGI